MTLSQIIEFVGNDKVECQFIGQTTTNAKLLKDGSTRITFDTAAVSPIDLVANEPKKIAIAIFIPADKWNEAKRISAENASKPAQG